jgi:OmpA-OmpF porin, OOP family
MKIKSKVCHSIFYLFIFLSLVYSTKLQAQEKKATDTEALLNVTVTSMKDVPRPGEQINFVGKKTKKQFSGISDHSGKFSILIPKGDVYSIEYKNFSESVEYNTFEIKAEPGKIIYDLDIKYDPPRSFTLENVFFETGKSILRTESDKALNDLVEIMKIKTGLVIEIDGHTDNVGTPESNLKLSLDRANAVRNYLIQHGIAATRITAKGFGDTQPAATNDTEEGRQKNRRTEVTITKE